MFRPHAILQTHPDQAESIANHEALKYRFMEPELQRYEHIALVRELIDRMRPVLCVSVSDPNVIALVIL